jgi:hypothetical protein
VQANRHDPGLRALVELLNFNREAALARWRKAEGLEALAAGKAAYNEIQNTIDMIEKTPVAVPQRGGLPAQ